MYVLSSNIYYLLAKLIFLQNQVFLTFSIYVYAVFLFFIHPTNSPIMLSIGLGLIIWYFYHVY